MSDDRKKPGLAFWANVVVAVLMLDVLSIGPAWCFYGRDSGPYQRMYGIFYAPLLWPVDLKASPSNEQF